LNAIDHKTKYVLAHLFVWKRSVYNCTIFLRQIKNTSYKQILCRYYGKNKVVFVCDKFQPYKRAFTKLFLHVAKLIFGIPIKAKRAGLKHNNNHIERYNQDINDRIKVMRNFGSSDGAAHFLNLKTIVHNFINPHMQLKGLTPAEATDIDLHLGRKKFINLIKHKGRQIHHSLR
jgi:transposase-like protein